MSGVLTHHGSVPHRIGAGRCMSGMHKQQNSLQLLNSNSPHTTMKAWGEGRSPTEIKNKPPLPQQTRVNRYIKINASARGDQSPRSVCPEARQSTSRPSSVRSSTSGRQTLRPSRNSVSSLFPSSRAVSTHSRERTQGGISEQTLRLAGEFVDDDEALMEQIVTEATHISANLKRYHSESNVNQAGASGAGDLWILVGSEGQDFIQAYEETPVTRLPELKTANSEQSPSPERYKAEESTSPSTLASELKVHELQDCWEEISKLGIQNVADLGLLRPSDVEVLQLNPLQKRLLLTAMEREASANRTAAKEVQNATREWERMCDGDNIGWYAPAFTQEPAGMRITILEPPDLAGTIFDLGFGESRDSLSPSVTKRASQTQPDRTEYEISISIQRGEITKLDTSSGVLSIAVEGISKKHAKIQLSCGDGSPHEACILDEGSTNGTFLMRHLPTSFLPPKINCDSPDVGDGASTEQQRSRPQTPAQMIELQTKANARSDLQGVPYLRLGPKLVLGLTLLKESSCFELQDVQNKTEQLLNEGQLRQHGWGEVHLEHVCKARRKKANTHKLLQTLAQGAKSFVLSSKQQLGMVSKSQQLTATKTIVSPLRGPAHGGISLQAANNGEDHIFLTYQWDSQKIVKMIADALKLQGYHVWIDLDRMTGDINQRMAEAVEGAAVVCPCITKKYKTSANCMKELNYSDQRGCTMVPLILEACDRSELLSGQVSLFWITRSIPPSDAFDWQVGLITSNLLYVDFSKALKGLLGDDPDEKRKAMTIFDKKIGELRRALGDRGKKSLVTKQDRPRSASSDINHTRGTTARPPLA